MYIRIPEPIPLLDPLFDQDNYEYELQVYLDLADHRMPVSLEERGLPIYIEELY